MASNNSDFSVLLNANLNTDNIPKELQNLNAQLSKSTSNTVKLKVGIDEDNKPIFNDFIKTVNTYKDKANNIFKQINLKNIDTGEITTKFEQVTSSVQKLSETTRKFVDESGAINTVVRNVDNLGQATQTHTKVYKEFGETIKETTNYIEDSKGNLVQVGDTFREVSTVVSETSKSLHKYKDDAGAIVTEINELTKQGENLKTVIREEVDAEGQVIKTTELWNNATNSLISSHQEIINDEVKLTEQHRKLQESLVQTSKETNKIRNDAGELVTTITEVNASGEKIYTTITETDNGLGRLTTKVYSYKEALDAQGNITKQVIKDNIETINDQAKITDGYLKEAKAVEKLNEALVSTTTTHSKGKTIQFGDTSGKEYDALVTTIEKVDAANKKTIQTTYEFTNAQGQLVKQTRTTDENLQKVAEDEIEISEANKNLANTNKQVADSAKENAKAHDTLGQSLAKALSTLAQYYVASLPIRAFREAVSGAVTTVREFDSALIEFRKVSDLAGESLTQYVAKLAEMGEITGSTMQAMVEASTEFRKSGFSDEDSAKLASIAEKYRNVADEEISAGEAASFIIAQMKAFNIEAGQAEHIIDAVNEVANNFSVSSADLIARSCV